MKNLIHKIFEAYTSKKHNQETQNEFQAWLIDSNNHEEKESNLKKLWDNTPSEVSFSTFESWNKFKNQLLHKKKKTTLLLWQSIAALFILVSGSLLYILVRHNQNTFNTDLVEQYTQVAHVDSIYLPDGTLVHLNATTTLLYPTEFNGQTRSVYLIGEATFDVKQDLKKPFIVKTADYNVTALGTHFNVTAYANEEEATTTLLSGSIAIDNLKENTRTILKPEQQYSYNKNSRKAKVSIIDTAIITSWQKGELTIQNKTLKEIIHILERKYPVTFQYNWELINKTDQYNFKFNIEAPIEEVLSVIKTVSGVNYIFKNDICYLN